MNAEERELEEIYDELKSFTPFKPIPVFEVYLSTFSIWITIILYWFPHLLTTAAASDSGDIYRELLEMMPQSWWAFVFAVTALLKAFGLMFRFTFLRITGLVFSAILYSIIAFHFAMERPNIGMVQFVCMALFSLLAISVVKNTAIRN